MGELRHLAKGVLQPILIQPGRTGKNPDRLIEQACGICLDSATTGGGPAGEFGLNLGRMSSVMVMVASRK